MVQSRAPLQPASRLLERAPTAQQSHQLRQQHRQLSPLPLPHSPPPQAQPFNLLAQTREFLELTKDEVLIGNVIDVSTWMATSTYIHYITWMLGGNSFSHPSHLVHLGHFEHPKHVMHFLIHI